MSQKNALLRENEILRNVIIDLTVARSFEGQESRTESSELLTRNLILDTFFDFLTSEISCRLELRHSETLRNNSEDLTIGSKISHKEEIAETLARN